MLLRRSEYDVDSGVCKCVLMSKVLASKEYITKASLIMA